MIAISFPGREEIFLIQNLNDTLYLLQKSSQKQTIVSQDETVQISHTRLYTYIYIIIHHIYTIHIYNASYILKIIHIFILITKLIN